MEDPYKLPEGWAWTDIGSLFELKYGKGLVKEKRNPDGRYVVFGSGGVVGKHDSAISSGRTIIIGRKGSVGEISLSNKECWPIDTTYYIDNFHLNIPIKYWSFQLKYLALGQHDTSTAIPGLNRNDIYGIKIPLPPLAEQRRITAKLEALLAQVDAAKDHLAAVPSIIKRFRQSVLAAACSGRLTEDWRREHPGVEPASELLKRIREERMRRYEEECKRVKEAGRRKPRKPSNIAQNEFAIEGLIALPNGWTWTVLNDLSANEANSITDGPFGSKLKTEHYTESGPRVIRLQNISDGKFIDAKAHISPHHFENLRKHEIFGGDIVIAALGTDLPRACIIPNYVGHAIVKADCIRFKPHPSITNNQYMNASLNSDILKHITQSIVHGVGRPRLNQQQVKSLPIPLPPFSEQRTIVNRIEILFHRTSEVEERVAAATSHADRLTQSILAKAFRGELVPQDPGDEPASVLLEQIRKERTELKKKKKPQKRRPKTLSDPN